jgi:hypothetical protein
MNDIPPHNHDGNTSDRVSQEDIIPRQIFTARPTAANYPAPEGTSVPVNESGTYYICIMINGAWRCATLT